MISHRLPFSVNCSLTLAHVPTLDSAAVAAEAGFTAVEYWWPFATATPSDAEVGAFVDSVAAAGVRLVGLNVFGGDMAAGERGVMSWPGREAEFLASVETAVEIGRRLGTRVFNALYGQRLPGVPRDVQDGLADDNMLAAVAAVERIGGTVVLEPLSVGDRYPLRTAADALEVVSRVRGRGATGRLGLLADLYHLAVNGDDVGAVIDAHAAEFGHIQIADAPGRHEPGTGGLPLDDWLVGCEKAGYDGYVGLEYVPVSPDRVFDWMQPHGAEG